MRQEHTTTWFNCSRLASCKSWVPVKLFENYQTNSAFTISRPVARDIYVSRLPKKIQSTLHPRQSPKPRSRRLPDAREDEIKWQKTIGTNDAFRSQYHGWRNFVMESLTSKRLQRTIIMAGTKNLPSKFRQALTRTLTLTAIQNTREDNHLIELQQTGKFWELSAARREPAKLFREYQATLSIYHKSSARTRH